MATCISATAVKFELVWSISTQKNWTPQSFLTYYGSSRNSNYQLNIPILTHSAPSGTFNFTQQTPVVCGEEGLKSEWWVVVSAEAIQVAEFSTGAGERVSWDEPPLLQRYFSLYANLGSCSGEIVELCTAFDGFPITIVSHPDPSSNSMVTSINASG